MKIENFLSRKFLVVMMTFVLNVFTIAWSSFFIKPESLVTVITVCIPVFGGAWVYIVQAYFKVNREDHKDEKAVTP